MAFTPAVRGYRVGGARAAPLLPPPPSLPPCFNGAVCIALRRGARLHATTRKGPCLLGYPTTL